MSHVIGFLLGQLLHGLPHPLHLGLEGCDGVILLLVRLGPALTDTLDLGVRLRALLPLSLEPGDLVLGMLELPGHVLQLLGGPLVLQHEAIDLAIQFSLPLEVLRLLLHEDRGILAGPIPLVPHGDQAFFKTANFRLRHVILGLPPRIFLGFAVIQQVYRLEVRVLLPPEGVGPLLRYRLPGLVEGLGVAELGLQLLDPLVQPLNLRVLVEDRAISRIQLPLERLHLVLEDPLGLLHLHHLRVGLHILELQLEP